MNEEALFKKLIIPFTELRNLGKFLYKVICKWGNPYEENSISC